MVSFTFGGIHHNDEIHLSVKEKVLHFNNENSYPDGKNTHSNDFSDFLVEATIMKGFEHPNILSLMGIIVDGEDIFVVLPYMANGDLQKHVLRKVKANENSIN